MTENNNSFENFETLNLEGTTKNYMLEAAKWGRFLGIVGFVMLALLVLIALFMIIGGGAMSNIPGFAASGTIIGLMYLLLSARSFFPTLYLYNYSVKMISAITGNSQEDFNVSVENLKSMFKFTGILMIVVLSFYALIIVFGLIAMMAAM